MIVHARYPIGETRVARQAAALIDAGCEVDVLCLREPGEPRREQHNGVRIRRLGVRRHRDRGMAFQLLEYLAFFLAATVAVTRIHLRRRYDTVQVHNLPDFLVFAALVPKLTGAAVILDLHDLMPEFYEGRTGRGGMGRRALLLQERAACRFADHVITVTEGWRQDLASRGSAPLDRSSVVMNLADEALFSKRAAAEGDGGDGFVVVYHGTFTARYGVDLLVEAADQLRSHIPRLEVRILGDGEQRAELEETVRARGLGDVVTISQGMLDASELPHHLADADVGVVANRANAFTDGILPTKLLEYVRMGIPAVVSRTPGVEAYFDETMVEYVRPGDVSALVEAILRLAADPARRRSLIEHVAAFEHDHNWSAEAGHYVRRVRQLAGRRGGDDSGDR